MDPSSGTPSAQSRRRCSAPLPPPEPSSPSADANGRPSVLRTSANPPDQYISSEAKGDEGSERGDRLSDGVHATVSNQVKPNPGADSERHHTHESEGKAHGPQS